MCGIAGLLAMPMERNAMAAAAAAMAGTLRHRGPDDADAWADEAAGVALIHRRLSIIDLSPQGRQPMRSADGRYIATYNGEIYNYQEIRKQLENEGSGPWRGHSDTEVMLAAFSAWGFERALQSFTGMFALVVWDAVERCLLLARDRLGEKPLYYGLAGSAFAFASELKAFRTIDAFSARVDRQALALYARYACVPAPWSIYEGVRKLPAGAWLCVRQADVAARHLPEPRRYWSLYDAVAAGRANPFRGSDQDAVVELENVLAQAVERQMVADVPLGAFLSGGIDSSCIVSLMQAASSQAVRTFTIGFNENRYDEAKYAKAIAQHLGTAHTELYVTPREATAVIPRLPAIYDEPFADSSQIPTFLVSRLARSQVTVSLSGDGGDELFAGYNRYFWGPAVARIPGLARGAVRGMLTAASPATWEKLFGAGAPLLPGFLRPPAAGDKLYKLARLLDSTSEQDLYERLTSFWDRTPVLGAHPPAGNAQRYQLVEGLRLPERMMYLDTLTYLPDDILVKLDRAAMAVSLETRVPMLDRHVVELAWRLPLGMRIRGRERKWLLRRLLERYVPRQLTERPKMGFSIPLEDWLRGGLRDWAESLLAEARLAREGFFDAALVRKHWREHLSGERNWQHLIWIVLMFGAWLEHEGMA
jgi:asparagine synthase (glutamine-hydrolysing)